MMELSGLSKDALSRIAQILKGQEMPSVSAFDFFGTDDEDVLSFAENFLGLEFTHWKDIEPFKKQKPPGMKFDYLPSYNKSNQEKVLEDMQDQADQEGKVLIDAEEYLTMVQEFLENPPETDPEKLYGGAR
jgi:hypothetical protein